VTTNPHDLAFLKLTAQKSLRQKTLRKIVFLAPLFYKSSYFSGKITQAAGMIESSNVNDIETKRSEASIMGIFAKSKRNEPVE
jgi:hypothetical protein